MAFVYPDKNGKMVQSNNFKDFEAGLNNILKNGYGTPAKPKSSGLTFAEAQAKLRKETGIEL